jgi:replicative DNA helicase
MNKLHDIDLEAEVLAAAAADEECLREVLRLHTADLWGEANRALHRTLKALHDDGMPPPYAVSDIHRQLIELGLRDQAGDHVHRLTGGLENLPVCRHKVDRLVKMSGLRRYRSKVQSRLEACGAVPLDLLAWQIEEDAALKDLRLHLRDIDAQADLSAKAPVLKSFASAAARALIARSQGDERPIPLPWGALSDALGGGLLPGLHVLVGGTGVGKTQWSLQVALEAAGEGVPVLLVELEMGERDVVARLAGLEAGVMWSELYRGTHPHAEQILTRAADKLGRLPIHVETASPYDGWDGGELYDRIRRLRNEHGLTEDQPVLVVVDYLQLAGGDDELRRIIGRIAYAGRQAARDLNACIIAVSSVARAYYGQVGLVDSRGKSLAGELGDERPKRSPAEYHGLGKESGEVEYAGDTVLTMCRKSWAEGQRPTPVWMALAKNRMGGPEWCPLRFDGCRFEEMRVTASRHEETPWPPL